MADTLFIVPFMQVVYGLLFNIAVQVWGLDRALLLAGLQVELFTEWLTANLFGPTITRFVLLSKGLFPTFVTVAMLLLAIGYLAAPFFKLRIVQPGKGLAWLVFAVVFYQAGPGLYVQGEQLRRQLSAEFYVKALQQTSNAGALGALGSASSGQDVPLQPLGNQFGGYAPDDKYVDGLDIAMSYDLATGDEVVQPPAQLPVAFAEAYFNQQKGSVYFLTMSPSERTASLNQGVSGILRLLFTFVIIPFGIVEQLIYLALAISMGILFLSMSIAILFSLFQATEPMAKTLIDMWLELFIFSVVAAVIQAFIVGFVVTAANTLNPTLTVGASLIGLITMSILARRAFGAIWDSLNRFTSALSQTTGGRIASLGEAGLAAAKTGAGAALAVGTAGLGAGVTLAAGGSALQAAGSALAGSDNLFSAAALGSLALPAGSSLKPVADQLYEGALSNRILGPAGGLMLRPADGSAGAPIPGSPPSTEVRLVREDISSAMQLAILSAPPGGYGDPQAAAQAIRDALGAQPHPGSLSFFVQHEQAIAQNVLHQTRQASAAPAAPPPSRKG